jgi:hypothetical protein
LSIIPSPDAPEGATSAGGGYWFTPLPVYLLEAVYSPANPVNAPAAMLWAHIHRNYAWRRRVFPSYAKLAEETGQSESAVKRQLTALKAAGALTWGATYGAKGRSSNEYALAPLKPFEFDRQVEVKNDPHPPVQVKNEPGVQVKDDPYPQVKNDLGVKNTVEVRTPLSPRVPKSRPTEPAAAPKERETSAAPDNRNGQAQQVAAAWTRARGGRRVSSAECEVAESAAGLLADGWPLDDLIALAEDMAAKYPTGRNLARHTDYWQPPKPSCASAVAPEPSMLPTWCRDLDCDDDTRIRAVTDADGFVFGVPCPDCHPDTQKAAA